MIKCLPICFSYIRKYKHTFKKLLQRFHVERINSKYDGYTKSKKSSLHLINIIVKEYNNLMEMF
jgi:hypothetical protein